MQEIFNAHLSVLELIQRVYPGKLRFTVSEVANIIRRPEQSVRNELHEKTFLINSFKEGRNRYFDIRDVAAYLDAKREVATKREDPEAPLEKIQASKNGRPTRIEEGEARRLGLTVRQLRKNEAALSSHLGGIHTTEVFGLELERGAL